MKGSILTHFVFDESTQFAPNSWGIDEPLNGVSIEASEIDMVITPLLCIDKNKQRVGYGKGYYDRFLSECKPTVQKIGVSLFPQLTIEIEDINEFDVKLDKILVA